MHGRTGTGGGWLGRSTARAALKGGFGGSHGGRGGQWACSPRAPSDAESPPIGSSTRPWEGWYEGCALGTSVGAAQGGCGFGYGGGGAAGGRGGGRILVHAAYAILYGKLLANGNDAAAPVAGTKGCTEALTEGCGAGAGGTPDRPVIAALRQPIRSLYSISTSTPV